MSDERMLAWGAKVSLAFREKVASIAADIGCDPSWLMACMAFETGRSFSPSVRNPASGATGLIQFMPATAQSLGTWVEMLAELTAEQQLDYVAKYFAPYRGRLRTLSDTYMAILWPRAIGTADNEQIFPPGSKAYLQNRGLDIDHDGAVTKAEAAQFVVAALAEGLRQENAIALAAPIEDRSTPLEQGDELRHIASAAEPTFTIGGADNSNALTTGGQTMPIAIGLLTQLIPSVIQLFSGRAQATIAEKTGADPQLAAQFMQGVIQRVGEIVKVPVTDDASAIKAVAVLHDQVKQQADLIAKLEAQVSDYLHDLTEAMKEVVNVRKAEVQIEMESANAAAERSDASEVRQRIDNKVWWAYGVAAAILAIIAIVELVVNKLIDGQIVGALILAFGGLGGAIITMVNYGYGSSGSSGAKDVLIGEMARRQPGGKA